MQWVGFRQVRCLVCIHHLDSSSSEGPLPAWQAQPVGWLPESMNPAMVFGVAVPFLKVQHSPSSAAGVRPVNTAFAHEPKWFQIAHRPVGGRGR